MSAGRTLSCAAGSGILRGELLLLGPKNYNSSRAVSSCLSQRRTWAHQNLVSYMLSIVLKRIFMLKCNLSMLRLTPLLTLLTLPIALTRLLCYHKRERPPTSLSAPTPEAIILSAFPIAWFFGFLYYTEVPSLLLVVLTVVAAAQGRHWLAALVRHLLRYSATLR